MTPKEKAQDLLEKFTKSQYYGCILCDEDWDDKKETAKQCALIAVDEILNTQWQFSVLSMYGTPFNYYWQQVKTEIEAL